MINEEKIINNCEEFELLIDGYLDGEIMPPEKVKLEEHLGTCGSCKAYLNDTAKLIEKTAYLPKQVEIGQNKKDELWNKIRSVSAERKNISPEYIKGGWFLRYRYAAAAASAVVVLVVSIIVIGRYLETSTPGNTNIKTNISFDTYWKVTNVKGSPSVENTLMKTTDSVGIGQWITTDDSSSADLMVSDIGKITIQPKSKVKITKSVNGEHRIQVEYGTIDADIDANPRSFFVDLPSVTAVDLGCSYKLTVDTAGNGLLYVKQGKVSLEAAGKESSLVPAGKFCMTKKDFGPGTPFMGNASPELKKALVDFDFGNCEGTCVNIILKNAKKTDAVTLVSILPRVEDQFKERVYAKVSGFVSPPRHIPEDSIPNINPECLEQWIEKIQEEVQSKIEKNMEKMQADMEKMGKDMELNGKDWDEWGKQWENFGKDFGKDFDKNFQYKFQHVPGHNDNDSAGFDKEQFKKDMQEMKKNMEEMKNEFDSEQFKKEMEHSKEELQRSKEEMKRANEEIKKAMKDLKKNMNMNFDFNFDTANFKLNIKKYNGDYEYDVPEAPDVPETPDAPDAPDAPETPVVPETPQIRLEENKEYKYNREEHKHDKYRIERSKTKVNDDDKEKDNDK